MKPYLFIIWANRSDVGKDTCAELLNKYIPLTIIKFSRAFKTPLEDWLSIPYGSLDDKSFRVNKVINPVTELEEEFTYNELMYNFFHVFKELYPTGNYLVPGKTKQTILNTQGNIAIVDLRNQTELELLKVLKDKYYIVLIQIISNRGEQKSTDKDIYLEDLISIADTNYKINNHSWVNINELDNQLRDIYRDIQVKSILINLNSKTI